MTTKKYFIDPISNLVTCDVAVKWQDVEASLNRAGYTLGYFNPKRSRSSVRELMMRNGPNLLYRQYGHPMDWCVQLRCRGKKHYYETKRVPRTAAGPDFKKILLSSGRRYAELQEVTLRFHPVPERVDWHWSFWESASEADSFLWELEARDIVPSYTGSYDVMEQPRALRQGGATLVTLRFAGLSGLVASSIERAGALMRRHGGETLRIARRKIVPFLEDLMSGERSHVD